MMRYRPEIDGLRALAVVPVILFHAGFPQFAGGFVGVDVFFVISGYLITSLILAERALGQFSLARFYERRARRILPALFLVMLACLPFAWAWMLPGDLVDFSKSLAYVPLFLSNVLFYQQSGYFESAAELKPLLHTWSLAVEEQYYLLFPLLLLVIGRWRRVCVLLLATVAVISLAWAERNLQVNPEAGFYLLPSRCWELFLGALLAFHATRTGTTPAQARGQGGWFRPWLAALGVGLIVLAVVMFDRTTPFPGLYALVPTVGTALVILFAEPQRGIGRVLASRPAVALGLISYSAYLWHQPLFAFARLKSAGEVSAVGMLALAMCALVLAGLSWRYVEQPFRRAGTISRRLLVGCAVLCMAGFIVLGALGKSNGGFPERLTAEQKRMHDWLSYDHVALYRRGTCLLQQQQAAAEFAPECRTAIAGVPTVMIWGDSHAAALAPGLRRQLPQLLQFSASACPPFVGVAVAARPQCRGINDFVLAEVERLQPSLIILHANWRLVSDPKRIDLHLAGTLAAITRAAPTSRVLVVGGVPQWSPGLPVLLLRSQRTTLTPASFRSPDLARVNSIDTVLERVASQHGAQFFAPTSVLCNGESCLAMVDWQGAVHLTAWDAAHLTAAGSDVLAQGLFARGDLAKGLTTRAAP